MVTARRRWRTAYPPDTVGYLCVILMMIGFAGWAAGIRHRGFDYDEFEHAHVIWLIGTGLRPFRDFFECHPPFLWYPLSLVFRIAGESYSSLFALRAISALGHLAFFLALGANVALSIRRTVRGLRWKASMFALAAALVGTNPAITDYLLEFRLDSWPNALTMFAIYRYRLSRTNIFRAAAKLGFFAGCAALCSPKLGLFAGLFAIASFALEDHRGKRLAGASVGAGAAVGLSIVILLVLRLSPIDVYRLSITYHNILNQKGGFGHGLATSVWRLEGLLAVLAAGVCAWAFAIWRRVRQSSFELAILAFLCLQLRVVSIPYKQYFAPWFLLGIAFLPYMEVCLARTRPLQMALISGTIVYVAIAAWDMYRGYDRMRDAQADVAARVWMEQRVPPGGVVAASMDRIPIFRRSPFYHLATSFAPSGFDTTKVMEFLNLQPYSDKFSRLNYQEELEALRPSLVLPRGSFTPFQQGAIDEYLVRHAAEYRREDGPAGEAFLRIP